MGIYGASMHFIGLGASLFLKALCLIRHAGYAPVTDV